MKEKTFYSHLVNTQPLEIELDQLSISQDEKTKLHHLIYTNIHLAVMDKVMTELPEHEKKQFLTKVHANDHEAVWDFLSKRTINIEGKIKKVINELIEEFKKDIISSRI